MDDSAALGVPRNLIDKLSKYEIVQGRAFPYMKLFSLTNPQQQSQLCCGTRDVLLPMVLVEKKSAKEDMYARQNQVSGGLVTMFHAQKLVLELSSDADKEANPVVFGWVNVGHV